MTYRVLLRLGGFHENFNLDFRIVLRNLGIFKAWVCELCSVLILVQSLNLLFKILDINDVWTWPLYWLLLNFQQRRDLSARLKIAPFSFKPSKCFTQNETKA